MKTQTFLKGSFILFFSALITKALGALFKIPLTMLLGGVGMGYFGCAYGLFLPIYALSITGLSTAVASLVAKEHGAGHIQNVRKIRRTARLLFAGVGLLLSGFIWLFAVPFARSTAADASAAYAIRMMAPAAFFGCLAAVERGYYEGLCNMYPTAISQAVESIAKVVCGLLFSHYVFTHETQVLAYFPAGTPILPIAAAAAVLGVTLSTACGVLYFFFRNLGGDGLPKAASSSASLSIGSLMRSLFQIMLPVAVGSFVTNRTSLIDLCTMMRCFDHLQQTQPAALFQKFGAVAAESTFPALVYGAFSGMALTVFNLVPSVTNMFGKSVLPCAAQSWAKGQKEAVQKQLQSVLFLTALIALPAAGGLF
ncbi:MAG: oligosaccharide flippase family protein, partial [Ruminococcus callidus]|nr:oligosaccharide flippase family protein [Ruminococcus sp.]MDY6144161.1 oligosaccharide flippase family protein [Ruminococcus callidus]